MNTFENVINATYALNNKAGISFRMRHYWSGAENKEFFQLQDNGTLLSDVNYNENKDNNYNAFNIDLVFRWIFAPGSELSLAWKNSISTSGERVISDYWNNFSKTWKSDQINSLSLKILYYIDYNSLRGRRSSSCSMSHLDRPACATAPVGKLSVTSVVILSLPTGAVAQAGLSKYDD